MSEMEQALSLLKRVPEYKLRYALDYLKGLTAEERDEIPNAETIAAFEEGDRLINDPTVKGYHSAKELFEALDAEDEDAE